MQFTETVDAVRMHKIFEERYLVPRARTIF